MNGMQNNSAPMGPTGGIMTSLDQWDWKTDAPEFTPQVSSGGGMMASPSPPTGPPPPPPPSSQVPMPSFGAVPMSSGQIVTPVLVAGLGAPATWGSQVPAQGGWGESKPLGQLPAQGQPDQMYSAFQQNRQGEGSFVTNGQGGMQSPRTFGMGGMQQNGMQQFDNQSNQNGMLQPQGMMQQGRVMAISTSPMQPQLSPMSQASMPNQMSPMGQMQGQMSPIGSMGGQMQMGNGQMQLQPMNGEFVQQGGTFVPAQGFVQQQPGFVNGMPAQMGGTFVAVPANGQFVQTPQAGDGKGLEQNISSAQQAARQRLDRQGQGQQGYPMQDMSFMQDIDNRERDITAAQLQARQRVFGNAPNLIEQFLRESNGRAQLTVLTKKLEAQVRKASGKSVKEVIDGCEDLFSKLREGKVCLRGFEGEEDEPRHDLFAVTKSFDPTSRTYGEVQLRVGELLLVTERTPTGWCRGQKVRQKASGTSGWFPLTNVRHLGRPTDGRLSLLEAASSLLVRINTKEGRLSVDLAGFVPPLNDTDVAKFATWLAPRLSSLKGKDFVAEVTLARNAVSDRGVDILLQVLLRQEVPVERLDVRANEVGSEGLAAICSYIQTTPLGCVKELLLDENPLDRSCTARLFECLHQHPAYRSRSDADTPVWLHPGSHDLETPSRILARTRSELGVKVGLEEANISTLASSWRRGR